jgi:hypothetical protein
METGSEPTVAVSATVQGDDQFAGMPTAWRNELARLETFELDLSKRLDELELQARVTRRWIADDYPDHWCDDEDTAATLARIEAEERGK